MCCSQMKKFNSTNFTCFKPIAIIATTQIELSTAQLKAGSKRVRQGTYIINWGHQCRGLHWQNKNYKLLYRIIIIIAHIKRNTYAGALQPELKIANDFEKISL